VVAAALSGTGEGPLALLRLAGVAAGSANLLDNLPAHLALEPVTAGCPERLGALLVGVGAHRRPGRHPLDAHPQRGHRA
jgi:arsenical pump membrane protein